MAKSLEESDEATAGVSLPIGPSVQRACPDARAAGTTDVAFIPETPRPGDGDRDPDQAVVALP